MGDRRTGIGRMTHSGRAAPLDDETQNEIKQLNTTVFMSRLLRPHEHQMQEPKWLTRAVNLLPSVEDNYLEPLPLDPRDQCIARSQLVEVKTFEINKRYAGDLEAQIPMPKDMLQRTRYALLIDSTFSKNVPIGNVPPDVIEVLVTMSDPTMRGTYKEPPPKGVIIYNVFDHMTCENFLLKTAATEHVDPTREMRTQLMESVRKMATAMKKTQRILLKKLNVPEFFVAPPGFNLWPPELRQILNPMTEVCQYRGVDFAIYAPNIRMDGNDLRPTWLSQMGAKDR